MVGIELSRAAPLLVGLALVACAHEEPEPPAETVPAEAGLEQLEAESSGGECLPVEEAGVDGFDYLVSKGEGALRIEFRDTEFGHKMVRVVEQRPDGSTRDLRYRSPEEELVIVKSKRGEDPERIVLTGEEAMTSPDAAWLGELLMQARAVCEYRGAEEPPVHP